MRKAESTMATKKRMKALQSVRALLGTEVDYRRE
jgi:hypothetical protein